MKNKLEHRIETEVLKAYSGYFDNYFKGDIPLFSTFVDADCRVIGTSEVEVLRGREAIMTFYEKAKDEIVGRAEFRNRKIEVVPVDTLALVEELCDAYILIDQEWRFYSRVRLSTFLRETTNGWKVVNQHGSLPDSRAQEGETIAFELIRKENEQLRDAVKRRTAELELKTRELEIEASLERVRSRSMSMQKSDELKEVIQVVYEQLVHLDIFVEHAGFIIDYKERDDMLIWLADEKGAPAQVTSPYFDSVYWNRFNEAKEKGSGFFAVNLTFEEKNDHYLKLFEFIPGLAEEAKTFYFNCPGLAISTVLLDNVCLYVENFSGTPYSEEDNEILKRFGKVFQQSFTRFLDLKKAEAQARESKIEAALERVRARALAMQEPEELKAVADVMRHEMGKLGLEELETSSIYINDESPEKAECWYAIKDIRDDEKILVNDSFSLDLNETWVGREMLKFYQSDKQHVSILMTGEPRVEWIRYCEEKSVPLKGYYGEVIPDRTYHLYKFSHGAIGAATAGDISEENWNLLKRAASVFSLAYSRFRDLTQARIDLIRLKEEKLRAEDALSELKATQAQLVHAEKMASLGELTAGIAHEIQNPLNFVNNFSEVNSELIEELLEELENGDLEEVKALIRDMAENEEKIKHHGKRADGIVKGMLQHSRTSTGDKELVDINELADEYLRLAYHGMCAKDKRFNADFEMKAEKDLPKINVVPQDFGRVLLNLINNAFFAVSEKAKQNIPGYKPMVTVTTTRQSRFDNRHSTIHPPAGNEGIEIRIKDNGTGIPESIKEKIFQPFFTTKPTGEGTGLGLSLSYDIITKGHGGTLEVETKAEEGTALIITIPLKS